MENNVIILAGGQGKRMKTNMPKALCNVIGEPMLEWVLTACENAELDDICVVKGYEGQQIEDYLAQRKSKADICTVMQEERLGTGHAVMQAADFLKAHAEGNQSANDTAYDSILSGFFLVVYNRSRQHKSCACYKVEDVADTHCCA